jgi:hypothetical protein
MPTLRNTSAAALLISSADVASIAAPGLAVEGPEKRSSTSGHVARAMAEANAAPVAEDDVAGVTAGGSIVVAVMDNDYDPDATSSSILQLTNIIDAPTAGMATIEANTIEYVADSTFVGTDSFTYEITDGELTDQATVTVTIVDIPNGAPTANEDSARTRWYAPVIVDVTANDTDPEGDHLTAIRVRRPDHGRAEVVRGKVRYIPGGQYVGPVLVAYTVQDDHGATATGHLTVRVRPRFTVEVKRVSNAIALRPMTVRGKVSTRLNGPVTASLQRWRDGHWKTLSDRRLRSTDDFELRWRPDQPGKTALRLKAHWNGGHHAKTSRIRVTIGARFDPQVHRVTARDLPHTWRPGCPVGPSSLRAIRMSYWDYRGRLQRGTLIGASWVTQDYIGMFRHAFDTKFMIKKMYPVDRYGGEDKRAMRAGNTSAFNCRHVTGNPYRMSQHSYGNAIDINTFENPYVTSSRVYPPKAADPYYYRRDHNLQDPGVITARTSIARALWNRGWAWGARWSLPDYQHWSSNGG